MYRATERGDEHYVVDETDYVEGPYHLADTAQARAVTLNKPGERYIVITPDGTELPAVPDWLEATKVVARITGKNWTTVKDVTRKLEIGRSMYVHGRLGCATLRYEEYAR